MQVVSLTPHEACLDHSYLMLKLLQAHLLRPFVANLKTNAIYARYPGSFCDTNLAIQKVFVFSDSGESMNGDVLCPQVSLAGSNMSNPG